jgi:hypothetical protein
VGPRLIAAGGGLFILSATPLTGINKRKELCSRACLAAILPHGGTKFPTRASINLSHRSSRPRPPIRHRFWEGLGAERMALLARGRSSAFVTGRAAQLSQFMGTAHRPCEQTQRRERARLSVSRGSCPCRSRAVVEMDVLGREDQVGQGGICACRCSHRPRPQGCALLVHDCKMIADTASHRKPHRYGSVPYFNSGGGTRGNVPDSVQVLVGGRR